MDTAFEAVAVIVLITAFTWLFDTAFEAVAVMIFVMLLKIDTAFVETAVIVWLNVVPAPEISLRKPKPGTMYCFAAVSERKPTPGMT